MEASKEKSHGDDDSEWLRALYLARVCTAAPSKANTPSSTNTTTPSVAARDEEGVFHDDDDDLMEDDDDGDDGRAGIRNNNNNGGNGFEIIGPGKMSSSSKSIPLSSRPHTRSHTKIGVNINYNNTNEDLDNSNDPSFWQDASSIKLLTPIPQHQQQSIADMSAASTSLFFPQSTMNSTNNHNNLSSSINSSNQSTIVANFTLNAVTTAVAIRSALDTLWNKFQLRHSP